MSDRPRRERELPPGYQFGDAGVWRYGWWFNSLNLRFEYWVAGKIIASRPMIGANA